MVYIKFFLDDVKFVHSQKKKRKLLWATYFFYIEKELAYTNLLRTKQLCCRCCFWKVQDNPSMLMWSESEKIVIFYFPAKMCSFIGDTSHDVLSAKELMKEWNVPLASWLLLASKFEWSKPGTYDIQLKDWGTALWSIFANIRTLFCVLENGSLLTGSMMLRRVWETWTRLRPCEYNYNINWNNPTAIDINVQFWPVRPIDCTRG